MPSGWPLTKLLYPPKAVLLAPSIAKLPSKTVFESGKLEKLKDFVKFSIYVYLPWWLNCHSPTLASMQDLLLMHKLNKWEDKAIKEMGMKAMKIHLWYLSHEMSGFALFSEMNPKWSQTTPKCSQPNEY